MVNSSENIRDRIQAWANKSGAAWFPAFASGTPLTSLHIDSIEIVRFVAFLQKEFHVPISPDHVFGGPFDGLDPLIAFLSARAV